MVSSSLWAVDTSRLWLPKKYAQVKPKLMLAAQQAEESDRCSTVVAGEMILRKNTPQNYYFVITCRDSAFKTYNLTYLFPIAGDMPSLKAEERSRVEQQIIVGVIDDQGIDEPQAIQLCRNAMIELADEFDVMVITESALKVKSRPNGSFYMQLPFTAQSELGNAINYRADCRVNPQGEVKLVSLLEEEGALTICRDNLRVEAALYGRIIIDEQAKALLDVTVNGDFIYSMPFDVKTRIGAVIRYGSQCQVNTKAEAEVTIKLLADGALANCKDELADEFDVMTIAESELKVESLPNGSFYIQFPFTAQSVLGSVINYRADCRVPPEGQVELVSFLEEKGALAICRDTLHAEAALYGRITIDEQAKALLDVTVNGDFIYSLPFDVKNRIGTVIRYGSQCQVSPEAEAEVTINLLAAGALVVCKGELGRETLLMKSVEMAEQASTASEQAGRFSVEIPFTANDPNGNRRNFKGYCEVDEEGEAEVVTKIDKDSIYGICIEQVRRETTRMKSVVILEAQLSPLQGDDDDGYVGVVPFDARDPRGKTLRFEAECRVGGNGASEVKLRGRR
ncbi:MAG: hypothetical protein ACJAYG_002175 [Oceanicoccus sp.]|jgi:hypothetical protein